MTSDRPPPKEPTIRRRRHTNTLATVITSATALALAAAGVTPAAAQTADGSISRPGVIRDTEKTWYLNEDLEGGAAEISYGYGTRDDSIHVMGDWDGDGVSTPGVIRPDGDIDAPGEVALKWYLRNSNTPGPADEVVTFGHADNREDFDTPIVGDWDGDGDDTVGVVIPDYDTNELVWKLANDHANATVDVEFRYGEPYAYGRLEPRALREVPVVGDWDGDGDDTPGIVSQDPDDQPSIWELRDELGDGPADHRFSYGTSDDRPLVGDWDGDGDDTPAVNRRGTRWYVSNDLQGGVADVSFAYGRSGDHPIVWETTQDGSDRGTRTAWTTDSASLDGSATAREPAVLDAVVSDPAEDWDTVDLGFTRAGSGTPSITVEYADGYPHEPGSGREVEMEGNRFLHVTMHDATLPQDGDVAVADGSDSHTVVDLEVLGEHEQVTEVGVGLSTGNGTAPAVDFRLRTVPGEDRVLLDVKHAG